MKEGVIIYGCYGYTGQLICEHAVKNGLSPTLAGRDEKRVKELADRLQLPYRSFDITDAEVIAQNIKDYKVVLHCAGPFKFTAQNMVSACLATGTHYLDITGEYQVFEEIFKRDIEANKAEVLLMPGVGFDVVPSDCLALYLKEQLPTADTLTLALLQTGGKLSHGTAITVAENLGEKCMVRRKGKLTQVDNGKLLRTVDFGDKQRRTVAIPWGDISTAFRSTKIPDITVYNYVPQKVIDSMRLSNYLGFLLRWGPFKKFLINRIKKRPAGPDEVQRSKARTYVWGEVKNTLGINKKAVLEMPEGYTITAWTAVKIVQHVLNNTPPFGAKTPAQVFGKDFILEFEGVKRRELN